MKSTEYIEWDKLEQIPFCLCRIAEDEENQEIDVIIWINGFAMITIMWGIIFVLR